MTLSKLAGKRGQDRMALSFPRCDVVTSYGIGAIGCLNLCVIWKILGITSLVDGCRFTARIV